MILYNPRSWFGLIFEFHRSDTFRTMIWVLLAFALYTTGLTWVELQYREYFAFIDTVTVHSLLGFIMGLLLVFRTNTGYDRWWEGRKQWGALVNSTRHFSYPLAALLPERARERHAAGLGHVDERDVHAPHIAAVAHTPDRIARVDRRRFQQLRFGRLVGRAREAPDYSRQRHE